MEPGSLRWFGTSTRLNLMRAHQRESEVLALMVS